MKAVERAKLVRSLRQESRRLRLLVLVIGFFLVTLTFVVLSKPDALLFNLNGRLSVDEAPRSLLIRQATDADATADPAQRSAAAQDPKPLDDFEDAEANANTKATTKDSEERAHTVRDPQQSGKKEPESRLLGSGGGEGEKKGHRKVTLPTVSNYTIRDAEDGDNAKQQDSRPETENKLEMVAGKSDGSQQQDWDDAEWGSKPLCDFSNFRANVCEMRGNIRIHPNASSVMYMEPASSKRNELWKLKPYPRKGDELCLSKVTELTVKSSKVAPECTKYHNVPVVVFALTGYTGNLFHDFTDALVPLFTTASEFNGEVQFLITDMAIWWTRKYHVVFKKLSNYPLIDFNKDTDVHCVKHAIVGLHAYMEFTIDPSKAPHNYTMVDFNRFMRRTYELPREAVSALGEIPKAKPRLLIISRQRTRMFLNLPEIIAMAEGLGFELVVEEANVSSDLSQFSKVVNSVDVMMGVHGAGLTNCVFLPHNATLIQIVPWGGIEGVCRIDFGDPAEQMGLRYKQYSIAVHESSLTDQYPLDHEIFKNPLAFHKGFEFIKETFMDKQNVRLDCNRFRPVLLQTLDLLNQ
ncbi:alpha-1,3-arabinosyltransferase XAT2-like [Triticum dicoccoides]|uniref:alpha-1,3-arabinosyltransferase XAT2-like n=1 Tax=Triticum dicoccoides TaxID=85692 RepID=UPI001890994E|nr:alpha-1,3-arabinosyltransferase XAT2-like [Triticum dicoccoides]